MARILVKTKTDLKALCDALAQARLSIPKYAAFSLDTETYVPDGRRRAFKKEGLVLDRARIMYVSIARKNMAWGIPTQDYDERCLPTAYVLDALQPFLNDNKLRVVMHHANYDVNVLMNHGIKVNLKNVYCTMIAGHCWDERLPNGLKFRCHMVGMELTPMKHIDMNDLKAVTKYAVDDAVATWRLYEGYELGKHEYKGRSLKLVGRRKHFFEREMQLLQAVIRMERRGMKVDTKKLGAIDAQIKTKLESLTTKIYVKNGKPFNIGSRVQLADFLHKKLKLPVEFRTPTGRPATDKLTLVHLRKLSPYVRHIVDYNALKSLQHFVSDTKGLQLYTDACGRIHSTYSQVGARTNRASSSNPNLQQIPSKTDIYGIRKAFIARKGHVLIVVDMDQIELRLMANHSRDPMLLRAYKKGISVHIQTAVLTGLLPKGITKEAIKGNLKYERAYMIAKNCNFGLMYMGSAFTLHRQLLLEGLNTSEEECEDIVDRYWTVYNKIPPYRMELCNQCRRDGYILNICGRPFRIDNINAPSDRAYALRRAAERQCVNTLIQGGAADVLKYSMILCDQDPELKEMHCRLLFSIHDETISECPESEAEAALQIIKRNMETLPSGLTIPVVVPLTASGGIGKSWAEAKG